MLSVSSEVMFRKNLEGSRTQGLGPPSNSISFEEPRVTKATEEGSTACRRGEGERRGSIPLGGLRRRGLALLPTRPCRGQASPKSSLELSLLISNTTRTVVKIQRHRKALGRTVSSLSDMLLRGGLNRLASSVK